MAAIIRSGEPVQASPVSRCYCAKPCEASDREQSCNRAGVGPQSCGQLKVLAVMWVVHTTTNSTQLRPGPWASPG